MDNRPIGVFDSGLGGLTVVAEIQKVLPNEDIIYLGDTARVPYGTRSFEIIKKFSKENVEFLLKHDVKCIVIACNTSSAVAYDYLVQNYTIPIIDVINPTVAELSNKVKRIGLIGTKATISSGSYVDKLKAKSPKVQIFEQACPLFVPLIEEGEIKGEIIKNVATKYLADIAEQKPEALIMGCTHYPIIESIIKQIVGKNVELINPGVATAHYLKKLLAGTKLEKKANTKGQIQIWLTDTEANFVKVAFNYLKRKLLPEIKRAVYY